MSARLMHFVMQLCSVPDQELLAMTITWVGWETLKDAMRLELQHKINFPQCYHWRLAWLCLVRKSVLWSWQSTNCIYTHTLDSRMNSLTPAIAVGASCKNIFLLGGGPMGSLKTIFQVSLPTSFWEVWQNLCPRSDSSFLLIVLSKCLS